MYLNRRSTNEDLLALADQVYNSGAVEEVVITSTTADGGGASGEVSFPKWLLLTAVEELIIDRGIYFPQSRNLVSKPDWRGAWSAT